MEKRPTLPLTCKALLMRGKEKRALRAAGYTSKAEVCGPEGQAK